MSSISAPALLRSRRIPAMFLHGLVALLLCACSLPLHAQSYFFGSGSFPVGSMPSSVAVGDFNHDGIMDLVVANSN